MSELVLDSVIYPSQQHLPAWLLDRSAIRAIEQHWLAQTPPGALMATAGAAVATRALQMWRALPVDAPVILLVGPGNNGGDALVAGRHLLRAGLDVRAAACGSLLELPPAAADARAAWVAWRATGQPLHALEQVRAWLEQPALVIDGLFGIGLARPLEGMAATLAGLLREREVPVLAIDVPSGLDADTGAVVGEAEVISARVTVTMIADKPGLHTGAGLRHAGEVWVAPLCRQALQPPSGQSWAYWLDRHSVQPMLPAVAVDAHKGDAGDVVVVGGRLGMAGAARLAARGALAAGAGRVWIGREDGSPAATGQADPLRPEIMQAAWSAAAAQPATAPGLAALPGKAPVLVAGCGLGQDAVALQWLQQVLASGAAQVIDADALSLLAAAPDMIGVTAPAHGTPAGPQQDGARILTPHPLEAARLLGEALPRVQSDRIGAARAIARRFDGVVVLKGAGTVLARPDGQYVINRSGHPVLGTAGSGDVLAGCLGALLARLLRSGLPAAEAAWRAACIGTWLHGRAGEQLALEKGPLGVPALALTDTLPAVWASLYRKRQAD